MYIAALIVAAGRGSRAAQRGGGAPKQYADLAGTPVLWRTVRAFQDAPAISKIAVVIHADDFDIYEGSKPAAAEKLAPPAFGGATRQASALAGLESLAHEPPDAVLIHDAARPFVGQDVIGNVIEALLAYPGALAAVPLSDTLKRATPGATVAGTIARSGLWRAQTPQGFHFAAILAAHRAAAAAGRNDFTDDAALAEWAGLEVALVQGSEMNAKLTTAEDMAFAASRLAANDARAAPTETRTATGFDVHRFAEGDCVWLGGVRIPHDARLEGHSDADVVLHALTDALLGTIGDGDIGSHFPPSDPQWKGAPSLLFLKHAAGLVAAARGRIVNVDVTILAEAPRIGPHRAAMQETIAAALGLTGDRVGVKATTTEGLGFTGRREGIAAMATATVEMPARPA